MPTFLNFATATQWAGVITLASLGITVLGFFLRWGIRFRLVGITGFMAVLTFGLFALSLGPIIHTAVPGSVHYTRVYDTGTSRVVIALPPTVTEPELKATLQQAANDLFSRGRLSPRGETQLTVRARTILHPQPGVSEPLVLGQAQRSLVQQDDPEITIQINQDNLARLPQVPA